MKKVEIEEAQNGYVVRFAKMFGESIIESSTKVYHSINEVQEELLDRFSEEAVGYVESPKDGIDSNPMPDST